MPLSDKSSSCFPYSSTCLCLTIIFPALEVLSLCVANKLYLNLLVKFLIIKFSVFKLRP